MNIRNFLFKNKGIKQTIFKNAFWLGVATVVSKIFSLVLLVYVARILGAEEYGKFNFAFAFAGLFAVFQDFGLPQIVIREFSKDMADRKEFYSVVSLNIFLSIAVFGLVLAVSFLTLSGSDLIKTVLILGLANLVTNFTNLFISLFQAQRRMEHRTAIEFLRSAILLGFGLLIIFYLPSAKNLSYAYLAAAAFALPFVLIYFSRKIFKPGILVNFSVWKKFILMAWPLAFAGVFGILYNYVDSLMMGFWGMMKETGWYNGAVRIITATLLPGALISKSSYPLLSKFSRSKELFQKSWNHQMELMILFAVPMIVGGMVLSKKIIMYFYPVDFYPAVLALQILLFGIGFVYITRPFADVLVAANQQKKFFFISVAGALLNIVLNLILIPKYSFYGAAAATVATNILVLFIYVYFVLSFIKVDIFKAKFLAVFFISIFCSGLMYLVIKNPLIYNLNVFISIILGAFSYFLAFLLFNKFYEQRKKVFNTR